jgi:hypothetical protein
MILQQELKNLMVFVMSLVVPMGTTASSHSPSEALSVGLLVLDRHSENRENDE